MTRAHFAWLLVVACAFGQVARAACDGEEQKQLAPLVGRWDVTWTGPDGTSGTGTSVIDVADFDGCVLSETFAAPGVGYRMAALTVWDSAGKRWKQTRVDSAGHYYLLGGSPAAAKGELDLSTLEPTYIGRHRARMQFDVSGPKVSRWQREELGPRFIDEFVWTYSRPAASTRASDGAAQFIRLAELGGSWRACAAPRGSTPTATYSVVGGGAAVLERLYPDSRQEMVTLYSLESNRLVADHYCVAGNHVKLVGAALDGGDAVGFELQEGLNLDAGRDAHMHGGSIRWISPNRIETHWYGWRDGKRSEVTADFCLERDPIEESPGD